MAQDDYSVANGSGATVRADINANLAAAVSQNSGASAPSTTFAGMRWYDTTNGVFKRRNAANSGWLPEAPGASTLVQAKTSAYTVVLADFGTLIDVTSGTFTLGLTAAATLGDGFWADVRNSGSGVVTIDPNASETIDGATTLALNTGESCRLWCNGTGWKTVGLIPKQNQVRARVSFVAQTGPTIRDSFNVSSVTRNGTGDYTITFTNPVGQSGEELQVAGTVRLDSVSGASSPRFVTLHNAAGNPGTASVRINIFSTAGALSEAELVTIIVTGD
jgi:hypothetical protein